VHKVKVIVKDSYGNASTLEFAIKKGIIDETRLLKDSALFYSRKEFHPGFVNIIESEGLQLILGSKDLYDSFAFTYSKRPGMSPSSYSDTYLVASGLIPVQGYFTVRLQALKPVLPALGDRMVVRRTWGDKTDVAKATAEGEWFGAKFRIFGNFELITDTVPPVIYGGFKDYSNLSRSSQIRFIPRDDNDEIKDFKAYLDGRWLRFTNDKGRAFVYNFDERCDRGSHELKIEVSDEAGNTTMKTYHFTR
jgi:hypothetical protein